VARKKIISKQEQSAPSAINSRMIMPVVRKVAMNEAEDTANDWEYWLSQSPSKRLEAVTFIITQSLGKNTRMDKNVVSKRPLRS